MPMLLSSLRPRNLVDLRKIGLNAARKAFSSSGNEQAKVKAMIPKGFIRTALEKKWNVYKEAEKLSESTSFGDDSVDSKLLVKSLKTLKRLGEPKALFDEILRLEENIKDSKEILANEQDVEMIEMANSEIQASLERLDELETQALEHVIPEDEMDSRNAILEVQVGVGGEEAHLWQDELFEMYKNFCLMKGWQWENSSDHVAMISGDDVFQRLKYESGVHRVQRVPKTEKYGRLQTSAAVVIVMPEADEADVQIKKSDLRIETFRSSGPGGQSVNTTDSAVRITHLPTNISVANQDERSQVRNKENAMKILYAKLLEHERNKIDQENSKLKTSQLSSRDRSAKIRTYNFAQDRITDHRVNETVHGIDRMMKGPGLDDFWSALKSKSLLELLEAELESFSKPSK